jgi:ubiquinone/menaquinone biosynthesis C-methylase UbiE
MLTQTGERQVGHNLESIRQDHKIRYLWACDQLHGGESILDAGCGVGYGSYLLSDKASSVHSIDISEESISYARRYWSKDSITHDIQDLHFLEIPSEIQYDTIVAFEIIEHLIEPRLFLAKARKHLKDTGRIIISVPNEKQIPHTVELNPFHIRHYTPEEAAKLLTESGFNVVRTLSQDSQEISPGTSGKFLIVEASLTDVQDLSNNPTKLLQEAISASSKLINTRANALAKTKKDVNSLKIRLDEAEKKLSSKLLNNPNDENNISNETSALPASHLEDIDLQGLHHRLNDIESSIQGFAALNSSNKNQYVNLEEIYNNILCITKELEEQRKLLNTANTEIRNSSAKLLHCTRGLDNIERTSSEILKNTHHNILQIEKVSLNALAQQNEENTRNEELSAAKTKADNCNTSMLQRIYELECSERASTELLETTQQRIFQIVKETYNSITSSNAKDIQNTASHTSNNQDEPSYASLKERISLLEAQEQATATTFTMSQNELIHCKEALITSNEKIRQSTAKMLAISEENRVLLETNEFLALELERSRFEHKFNTVNIDAPPREPPSFGYIWRKLKYHNYFIPFTRRLIRNSLGLKKTNKKRRL